MDFNWTYSFFGVLGSWAEHAPGVFFFGPGLIGFIIFLMILKVDVKPALSLAVIVTLALYVLGGFFGGTAAKVFYVEGKLRSYYALEDNVRIDRLAMADAFDSPGEYVEIVDGYKNEVKPVYSQEAIFGVYSEEDSTFALYYEGETPGEYVKLEPVD